MTVKRLRNRVCNPHSPWNVKLTADTPLASTSANYSARFYRQTRYFPELEADEGATIYGPYSEGFTTTINTSTFTFPIYDMPLDTPRVKVTLMNTNNTVRSNGSNNNLQGSWMEVPVPNPALCLDGRIGSSGSDQSAIFICGNEAWEFWKFRDASALSSNPNNVTGWTAVYGGYIPNIYAHIGFFRSWGVRASGTMAMAGVITAEDCEKGVIDHALYVAIPNSGNAANNVPPLFIDPCRRGDKLSIDLVDEDGATTSVKIDADKLPHGTHFRLPQNFDVEGWMATKTFISSGSQTFLRAMIICLRDYGCIVSDTAGGVVQFGAEDSRTFGTPYSPWTTRPTGLGNVGRIAVAELPWNSFQQVATVDPLDQFSAQKVGNEYRKVKYVGV